MFYFPMNNCSFSCLLALVLCFLCVLCILLYYYSSFFSSSYQVLLYFLLPGYLSIILFLWLFWYSFLFTIHLTKNDNGKNKKAPICFVWEQAVTFTDQKFDFFIFFHTFVLINVKSTVCFLNLLFLYYFSTKFFLVENVVRRMFF